MKGSGEQTIEGERDMIVSDAQLKLNKAIDEAWERQLKVERELEMVEPPDSPPETENVPASPVQVRFENNMNCYMFK